MATWQDVEQLKADGRYRHAGQLAFLLGHEPSMGAHYGMRSDYFTACDEFRAGWREAARAYRDNEDGVRS